MSLYSVDGESLLRQRTDNLEFIFTARRYASAVLAVIVCLSVGLSVTSRRCTKMAKPRIRLTTPYDSQRL